MEEKVEIDPEIQELIDQRQAARKAKDFAKFHPGGSLGRRLLAKVKDYMISENLPIVTRESKISDTLLQISRTKMTAVFVI